MLCSRFPSALLLLGLWLGARAPVVRFGHGVELGRIDVISIHGLSHARMDGLGEVPQVALALLLAVSALLGIAGVRRLDRAAAAGAVALVVLVAARVATRHMLGVTPDAGIAGLMLLLGLGIAGAGRLVGASVHR
ncbi:MAG: hypothetical protein Q8P18_22350 [Pseudomonadota bacterium]|nr:hypothetical protein [Pseudomonadota bacterium]